MGTLRLIGAVSYRDVYGPHHHARFAYLFHHQANGSFTATRDEDPALPEECLLAPKLRPEPDQPPPRRPWPNTCRAEADGRGPLPFSLRPGTVLTARPSPRYHRPVPTKAESPATDPIAVAIGSRVTLERERAGITKEELGARSGLPSRYIWRVETAKLNIQLRNLSRIAAGLGLTVSQLTAGMEDLVENPLDRPKPKRRGPLPRSARTEEPG